MSRYERVLETFARSRAGGWTIIKLFTRLDRKLMKWSNARINTAFGTRFRKHALLLTTIGRKSGQPRDIPLLFARDGGNIVLIASNVGRPKNPAWFYNLTANPECTVRAGGKKLTCTARRAEGEERERLWRAAVAVYPGYEDYAKRTTRDIPVMVLTPRN